MKCWELLWSRIYTLTRSTHQTELRDQPYGQWELTQVFQLDASQPKTHCDMVKSKIEPVSVTWTWLQPWQLVQALKTLRHSQVALNRLPIRSDPVSVSPIITLHHVATSSCSPNQEVLISDVPRFLLCLKRKLHVPWEKEPEPPGTLLFFPGYRILHGNKTWISSLFLTRGRKSHQIWWWVYRNAGQKLRSLDFHLSHKGCQNAPW